MVRYFTKSYNRIFHYHLPISQIKKMGLPDDLSQLKVKEEFSAFLFLEIYNSLYQNIFHKYTVLSFIQLRPL